MVNAGAGEELAGLIKFSPKPRRCGRAGGESDTRGDKNTHPDEGAYRYFFSTSVSFVARPRINSRRILLRSVTRQGGEQQASRTKGLYPTNRRTYNNSPSYFSQLSEKEKGRERERKIHRWKGTCPRSREREKEKRNPVATRKTWPRKAAINRPGRKKRYIWTKVRRVRNHPYARSKHRGGGGPTGGEPIAVRVMKFNNLSPPFSPRVRLTNDPD